MLRAAAKHLKQRQRWIGCVSSAQAGGFAHSVNDLVDADALEALEGEGTFAEETGCARDTVPKQSMARVTRQARTGQFG